MKQYKPVKLLDENTANKIAAGEVIERPASVVRELLDNSIDAGSSRIKLEIASGGISSIRVTDDGLGMSKEDLEICTQTHSTSKISDIQDLLSVSSLGFRGEALSSIKAVSDLEIITTRNGPAGWKLSLGKIQPASIHKGTIIKVENLFDNFPARKQFLKRAVSESRMCKQTFIEKAMAHPQIEMQFLNEKGVVLNLPCHNSFKSRCLFALSIIEPQELFCEITGTGEHFSFSAVLGMPDIVKNDRRQIYIFVNGRRISDYGLVQAVEYGAGGVFPNGGHPVAFVFLTVEPSFVDFNIHPAKKEARFSNYSEIHHGLSSAVGKFYRQHSISVLNRESPPELSYDLSFEKNEMKMQAAFNNFEKRRIYSETINDYKAEYTPDKPFSENAGYPAAQDIPKPAFRFLGQVAGTFIAVEKNDALYLIDQHAAHERIIFEDMKATMGASQELLVPYRVITDSIEEDNLLEERLSDLEKTGFRIKNEGRGIWIVDAVPLRWKGTEKELSEDLRKIAYTEPSEILHDILAMSACRAACKDRDILDPAAAYRIVEKTFALPEPLCPHGRPLWIIIDREELFKRIKRT
ncbi:MAG: DNA mismatch repair protein MutL [Treponema sp.]|nr:MAG: DNA mismatch repair protein MutL [Treponema sp.]